MVKDITNNFIQLCHYMMLFFPVWTGIKIMPLLSQTQQFPFVLSYCFYEDLKSVSCQILNHTLKVLFLVANSSSMLSVIMPWNK